MSKRVVLVCCFAFAVRDLSFSARLCTPKDCPTRTEQAEGSFPTFFFICLSFNDGAGKPAAVEEESSSYFQ